MVSFESDYNNGVQPEILHRLFDTNDEQTSGYGNDPYCEQAKEKSGTPATWEQRRSTSLSVGRRPTPR